MVRPSLVGPSLVTKRCRQLLLNWGEDDTWATARPIRSSCIPERQGLVT